MVHFGFEIVLLSYLCVSELVVLGEKGLRIEAANNFSILSLIFFLIFLVNLKIADLVPNSLITIDLILQAQFTFILCLLDQFTDVKIGEFDHESRIIFGALEVNAGINNIVFLQKLDSSFPSVVVNILLVF